MTDHQVIPFPRPRAKPKTGFEVFDFWNALVDRLPVEHRHGVVDEALDLGLISASDRDILLMPVPHSRGGR